MKIEEKAKLSASLPKTTTLSQPRAETRDSETSINSTQNAAKRKVRTQSDSVTTQINAKRTRRIAADQGRSKDKRLHTACAKVTKKWDDSTVVTVLDKATLPRKALGKSVAVASRVDSGLTKARNPKSLRSMVDPTLLELLDATCKEATFYIASLKSEKGVKLAMTRMEALLSENPDVGGRAQFWITMAEIAENSDDKNKWLELKQRGEDALKDYEAELHLYTMALSLCKDGWNEIACSTSECDDTQKVETLKPDGDKKNDVNDLESVKSTDKTPVPVAREKSTEKLSDGTADSDVQCNMPSPPKTTNPLLSYLEGEDDISESPAPATLGFEKSTYNEKRTDKGSTPSRSNIKGRTKRVLFSGSKVAKGPSIQEEDLKGASVVVLETVRAPKNATISTIRAMDGCETVLSPVRRSARNLGKNLDLSDKKTSVLSRLQDAEYTYVPNRHIRF